MISKIFNRRNSYLGLFLFFYIAASAQTKYEFTHPQMGTIFSIALYANDSSSAAYASRKAFDRLDELNLILSDYREDSEVNRLCRTATSGDYVKVSDDLWLILQESIRAAKLSEGNFDVTIGPLTQLWRRMKRQKQLPTTTQMDEARQKMGIENILLNSSNQSVILKKAGMRIDFGGIGKGYAEDKMMEVLKQNGIKSSMIEGGGNILTSQGKDIRSKGWEILINNKKHYFKNAGISTSGDMYQFVEIDGKKYSHIVAPKTGIGYLEPRQITVIAKDGTISDWLSTAIYLMDKEQGKKLAKRMKVEVIE